MTSQRTGEGSAAYVPGQGNVSTQDVFGMVAPPQPYARPDDAPGPADFEFFDTGKKGELGWRLRIYDLRGGLNMTRGEFLKTHTRSKASTLDTRFREHLILPQYTTATQVAAAMDFAFMPWTHIYGQLVMGIGNNANASLFVEDATTGVVSALTYTPGSLILALVPIVIGGGNALRLCVVRLSGNAQIFEDIAAVPTINGTTMDAQTQACTALMQTFVDTNAILFLSNALRTIASTAAINAVLTTKYENIPDGGYSLGLFSLGGSPVYAWWVWPTDFGAGVSYINYGDTHQLGRIVRTTVRGTDPQEFPVPLPYVVHVARFRDGIVFTDEKQIYFTNGRVMRNLHWNSDRVAASDFDLRCRGFWVNGPELAIEVNRIAVSQLLTGDETKRWVEAYNYELDAWHQVSATETLDNNGKMSIAGTDGLPLSRYTGYAHVLVRAASLANSKWHRIYLPPYGQNPYYSRQTDGADSSSGHQFEASGTWESPRWILPGPAGRFPNSVKRITFGGIIDGAEQSVQVVAGGVQHTFVYGYGKGHQVKDFPRNDYRFSDLEVSITLTQGTNTRSTPQGLPVTIEGVTYLNETSGLKVPR